MSECEACNGTGSFQGKFGGPDWPTCPVCAAPAPTVSGLDDRALDAAMRAYLSPPDPDRPDARDFPEQLKAAIRAYLAAAPAPTVSGEPVAWRVRVTENGRTMYVYTERLPFEPLADSGVRVRSEPEPLYTHPAPTRAEVLEEVARFLDENPDRRGRFLAEDVRALAGEKP